MYLHVARKSRVVNHRVVKKRIYCPVICHLRLTESWVQYSLTSDPHRLWRFSYKVEFSFHLLKSQRCLWISEKEYDVHATFFRERDDTCDRDIGNRSPVCRTTSKDVFVPDTRILRRASVEQLSVCERPHVCTLPPLLTSARYPWICNLSISIDSHYFRVVVMYVFTLWRCMERGNAHSQVVNSSDTKRVECSFVDLSWQQIYYWHQF